VLFRSIEILQSITINKNFAISLLSSYGNKMLKLLTNPRLISTLQKRAPLTQLQFFFNQISTTPSQSARKPTRNTPAKNEDIDVNAVSVNLPVPVKPSIWNLIKEKLGYQGSYRYSQSEMATAAIRLYLCLEHQVEYDKFFEIFKLDDVFYSYCLITYLHVWMICVRLADEGTTGKFVRNQLVEAMWKDIQERVRLFKMNTNVKKKSIDDLSNIFNACLFGFDEGLLGDDIALASSIWRHMFDMGEIKDFVVLVKMCEYVRKNVSHMDTINQADVLKNGIVTFVKLDSHKIDHLIERENIKNMIKL